MTRSSGRSEVVSLSGIVNPAFDASDVIRIYQPDIDLDAICVIDSLTIPLKINESMQIGTRQRRIQ